MKTKNEIIEMAQMIKTFAINEKECDSLKNIFVDACKDFIFNSNGAASSFVFNNIVIDEQNEYFVSILVFNSRDEMIGEIKLLDAENGKRGQTHPFKFFEEYM